MILNSKTPLLFFFLVLGWGCSTQNNTVNEESSSAKEESTITEQPASELILIQDAVNDSLIKTVLLFNTSFELSTPIINLNTKEQLTLKFDDLGEDLRYFEYNIIKCDKNWNAIDESQMRYIDGYINGNISDFEYSQNTLTEYTHYSIDFPNYENYKISLSGNYIIEVADGNGVVISKRFQVVEQMCSIKPIVRKASAIMDANFRQEIDFDIITEQAIQNPIKNISVHLYKNGNTKDVSSELKPKFVDGTTLKYDFDNENVFDGGNEFRALNLKSKRLLLQYVKNVTREGNDYFIYLNEDIPRTIKTYSFKEDLNGKFLIKNEDRPEASHLNSEYFNVFFRLNYKKPLAEGDFYVFGGISNWEIKNEFKLKYNSSENVFEGSTFVKQGFYDYEYVYVKDSIMDESKVEGTHFATQNEYTIQVYWTDNFGEERLIGHKTFRAHQ